MSSFIEHQGTSRVRLLWYEVLLYISHGRQREVYIGHMCHVCVCLSVPRRIPTLLQGPGCKLGEWYRGFPLQIRQKCKTIVLVHGARCTVYGARVSLL